MSLLALVLVPVIHLHADKEPTLEAVNLPEPLTGFQYIACVRDLGGPEIRCYIANAYTMELRFADFPLKD